MGLVKPHHKDVGIDPIRRELGIVPSTLHERAAGLAGASEWSACPRCNDKMMDEIERNLLLPAARDGFHDMSLRNLVKR